MREITCSLKQFCFYETMMDDLLFILLGFMYRAVCPPPPPLLTVSVCEVFTSKTTSIDPSLNLFSSFMGSGGEDVDRMWSFPSFDVTRIKLQSFSRCSNDWMSASIRCHYQRRRTLSDELQSRLPKDMLHMLKDNVQMFSSTGRKANNF